VLIPSAVTVAGAVLIPSAVTVTGAVLIPSAVTVAGAVLIPSAERLNCSCLPNGYRVFGLRVCGLIHRGIWQQRREALYII